MNSSQYAQRSNRTLFIGALAVSAILLASGGFFLKSLLSGNSDKPLKLAYQQCVSTLRANGWNPDISKAGEIKATRADPDRLESIVYESGVLISACPAYTLTDYCAGAACPHPGVTFTLKQKEL